ncbi:hypothetical protein ACFL5W_01425 [Thermodesulfobacteriota bacterium]
MSIRMIAVDLYRTIQKVAEIEQALANAPQEKCEGLKEKLRQAKAERNQMRRTLDGRKD